MDTFAVILLHGYKVIIASDDLKQSDTVLITGTYAQCHTFKYEQKESK